MNMRNLKYFLACLAVLFSFSGLDAKEKKVESSSKKAPAWIMKTTEDDFSVFAQETDIDRAREKCLEDIRQYIITSVAANVTSEETTLSESHNDNGSEKYSIDYTSKLKTTAAKLPFYTGISLSNAKDIYWEKYRKDDGTFYYKYHVLYPFDKKTRNKMILDFRKYDKEQYNRLAEIRNGYNTLSTVAEIGQGLQDLKPLMSYFFDDVRKTEAEAVYETYKSAYSKICILPLEYELGRFTYMLSLDGRKLYSSVLPKLKSETAVSLSVVPQPDNTCVVTYDHSYCYVSDDNYVDITYSLDGTKLQYRHQFDVSEKDKVIIPSGVIEIDVRTQADSSFVALCSVNLRSKTDKRFEVREVSFNLPEYGMMDFRLSETFTGKGRHLLNITMPVEKLLKKDSRGMLQGKLTVDVEGRSRSDVFTFTLPYNLMIKDNE